MRGSLRSHVRALSLVASAGSAFFGLAMPRTSSATVIVPMTIEDMAKEADCIVRGKVAGSEAAWDSEHSRIYTSTEIVVIDPIHTPAGVPERVVVRTLGGEVGKVGMKVAGTERFSPNEDVVLFLRRDPLQQSAFQVVGMSQGKYRIEQEVRSGRPMAVPSVEGLAFVRPDETGTLKVDPNAPHPSVLPLVDLKRRILAVVGGRPTPPVEGPILQAPSSGPATSTPAPTPTVVPRGDKR